MSRQPHSTSSPTYTADVLHEGYLLLRFSFGQVMMGMAIKSTYGRIISVALISVS